MRNREYWLGDWSVKEWLKAFFALAVMILIMVLYVYNMPT